MYEKKRLLQERYRLDKMLGKGGQGQVFLAFDMKLKKYWAIKKIPADSSREAEIMRHLEHPALPRIVDILEEDGCRYLVMDYLEGFTLEEIKKSGKKIPWDKRIKWALQLCSLLEYLHGPAKGIIYQDMKPSNLMVHISGDIRIFDFGIASLSEQNSGAGKHSSKSRFGTPGFAAPEQYLGNAEERSDIYGFGAILRYMEQKEERETRLCKKWRHIADKCMEPSLGKRYRKISTVKRELQNLEEWIQARKRAYAGFIFLAAGFLMLLGAQIKKQELLVDAGRILGGREGTSLADTADYEEARRYFLREQEGTKKGELYRRILDAIEEKHSKAAWEAAQEAMRDLEDSEGTSWEKTGESIFLANVIQAYKTELGYSGSEGDEKASKLLQQAEKNLEENKRETYAPIYRIEIWYQLAKVYGKQNNPVWSIKYYDLLLEEKIPVKLEQEARFSAAALCRQMQNYEEAEKRYESYIKDFPEDAEAYCAYALMEAMERQNPEKAERLLNLMEKRGAEKSGFNSDKVKRKINGLTEEEIQ